LHYGKHLLLEVNGDDATRPTDDFRHGDREITHAAAEIYCRHPRFEMWGEYLFRVMKKTSQGIVKGIGQPPGADMISHFVSLE
jgi:hypothetical protein